MTLSEAARERLADVVELQPTKNADLADRWDMEGGSEVHGYLESELKDYYYRDDDSMIRATPEAIELITGEPPEAGDRSIGVTSLQGEVLEVLAGPEEEPDSVVATLHALRDAGTDTDVDAVRSALHGLADKGVVERVQRAVPTFRLAMAREDLQVQVAEPA
jgi:hypothetical protein